MGSECCTSTVIRAVLLPAAMTLLGDWNWYLPRWLEWLPEFSHGEEPASADSVPATRGEGHRALV